MKLSSSLLQAITLGVSVTAVTTIITSCEKQKINQNKEQIDNKSHSENDDCPACGMG